LAGPRIPFNYQEWIQLYPEFQSTVNATVAQGYFDRAGLYIANDGTGPIPQDPILKTLLYLTTAHLAQMYSGSSNGAASPLVGHLNSASEGSVSASVELGITSQAAQWWLQSRYGYEVWTLLAPYRMFRYVPGPARVFDPLQVIDPVRGGRY
jgi:hypothetical protein